MRGVQEDGLYSMATLDNSLEFLLRSALHIKLKLMEICVTSMQTVPQWSKSHHPTTLEAFTGTLVSYLC